MVETSRGMERGRQSERKRRIDEVIGKTGMEDRVIEAGRENMYIF